MKEPTLGIMISTHGDRRLARTLHSIATQKLIPGDDIVVVGDGPQPWAKKLVESFGPPFRYIYTKKTGDWGHTQMNAAIEHVRGDYITGQDHDDIYLPRAFQCIREAAIISPNKPLLVRLKTPELGILWCELLKPPLDGHCLVIPNVKNKIGRFDGAYDGDQRYINGTLEAWGEAGWVDVVTTLTRPHWKLWAWPVYQWDDAWAWKFLDPTQEREVGYLTMKREYPEEGGSKIIADWDPTYCEREAWKEISEFMMWGAQDQLHFMPHDEEQRKFLWQMQMRNEYDGSLVSYWPPDYKAWEAV